MPPLPQPPVRQASQQHHSHLRRHHYLIGYQNPLQARVAQLDSQHLPLSPMPQHLRRFSKQRLLHCRREPSLYHYRRLQTPWPTQPSRTC